MVKTAARRKRDERGSAVVLLVASLSFFMLGAMGLAIDGAQLYAQRQMAQSAADAAAQAGIVTIFDGSTPAIGSSAYYCTSANATSPCTYVKKNGYTAGSCSSNSGPTVGSDCIYVNPNPGVTVSNLDSQTPNELQVTVSRAVPMTLIKVLGRVLNTNKLNTLDVTAVATAAIVDVTSAVPILITQPWMSSSLSLVGNASITICGGPQRAIQVNSSSSTAAQLAGNAVVDLSKAGPADPGDCSNGTGADFADFGGPTNASGMETGNAALKLGTTGHYINPADPILDPLARITPPSQPANAASPTSGVTGNGCPVSSCTLYHPGTYSTTNIGGVSVAGNTTALLSPGIYYMYGNGVGFSVTGNGNVAMATGLMDNTTGTGWTDNVLFYFTGPNTTVGSGCGSGTAVQIGTINVAGNGNVNLVGSPSSSSYEGILFWVNGSAVSQTHSLAGNGTWTVTGTIYTADTVSEMGSSGSTCPYQTLSLGGNGGSYTNITGEVITNVLSLAGNAAIKMDLTTNTVLVRQIALVGSSGGSVASE